MNQGLVNPRFVNPRLGRVARALVALIPVALASGACAGRTPMPATAGTPAPAAPAGPAIAPPPFSAATPEVPSSDPRDPVSARAVLRRSIFVAAWTLVRDKHYDPKLGGADWNALRAKYEPLAVGAPDERTFYRQMNEMLGALGQSHLQVNGPGGGDGTADAGDDPAPAAQTAAAPDAPPGDPGLVVRIIDGRPTVSSVRPGSSADRAHMKPGFIVTHVGGRDLKSLPAAPHALRPVEERFHARLAIARRLGGPAGTQVSVRYLDGDDRPGEAMLTRDPPPGKPVQVGLLPPLYPEVRVSQVDDVGIIAFNFFLLEPVLTQVQRAIEGFRTRGARGLILDLRGNPGGLGAMAIPIAARLVARPLALGTIQFRDYGNTLTVTPPMGVTPFAGKVVILTDEATASTSEILAAGLQEGKRALVVGDTTLGAVLPSALSELPGGALIQYVVADFRTPGGMLLEGRGVQPDQRILETRAGLLTGRDVVLEAGLAVARGAQPGALRSAEAVLDDYARAIGGARAWRRHKSMRSRREIEAVEMQLHGTEERHATAAGQSVTITNLAGMGQFKQGNNGKVRWSEDPINGLRILAGAEDEEASVESRWMADLELKSMYQAVRSLPPPVPVPAGKAYECVELVPRLAKPSVACFDARSHLRVLQKGVHATPQGDVPYQVVFKDWRQVGGVKIAFEEEMTAGPVTLRARVAELVFDVKVDPALFALPAAGGPGGPGGR